MLGKEEGLTGGGNSPEFVAKEARQRPLDVASGGDTSAGSQRSVVALVEVLQVALLLFPGVDGGDVAQVAVDAELGWGRGGSPPGGLPAASRMETRQRRSQRELATAVPRRGELWGSSVTPWLRLCGDEVWREVRQRRETATVAADRRGRGLGQGFYRPRLGFQGGAPGSVPYVDGDGRRDVAVIQDVGR